MQEVTIRVPNAPLEKNTHILCMWFRAARACPSKDSPLDLQKPDRKQTRKQANKPADQTPSKQANELAIQQTNKQASKQGSIMSFGFYSREGVYQ